MTGRLASRLATLERRSDLLAAWRNRPASECPDAVLEALIAEAEGRTLGCAPTDAELRAAIARGAAGGVA